MGYVVTWWARWGVRIWTCAIMISGNCGIGLVRNSVYYELGSSKARHKADILFPKQGQLELLRYFFFSSTFLLKSSKGMIRWERTRGEGKRLEEEEAGGECISQ